MAKNGKKEHGDAAKGSHSSLDDHHVEHEEHEEGEPWLVSYADMMTLLFGFFVVMYSFASKNTGSQEYIKMKLEQAFSGKESTEGMNIVELTEHLVKLMTQNANEVKKTQKNSSLSEEKNQNSPKEVDTQKVSSMIESLKILMAGIDKDVFEKDEKQAAIFEGLKVNLNEKLGNIQVKNEGRDRYSAVSVSLGLSDIFTADEKISASGMDILNRISLHSKKMIPRPQIKIEVFSEATSNPKNDISKTVVLANGINEYLLNSGLEPSLLASAAYGSMKPLVDYVDKNGAVDKIANKRNNRVIITIEKRLLEKTNVKM